MLFRSNPDNEGKVFLYKYGKKIFDKLKEASEPQFADEEAINPFDLWSGANFKLKIRNVEGYRNYDKSEFDSSKPLFDDDDKLEEVYKKEYSLQEFLDPKNFKTYEELKARLNKALSENVGSSDKANKAENEELAWNDEEVIETPKMKTAAAPKLAAIEDDEDDESLEFFKKMAAN